MTFINIFYSRCTDPQDYTGGTFGVNFGTGANDRQCIQITLVNDAVREEREDFFVDVVLDDTGRVRAGDPSRTIVAIEGIYHITYKYLR